MASPVRNAVLEVLQEGGFSQKREPLRIVELTFEFDAVLEGPGSHHALVVVVEQDLPDLGALLRRLNRLTLALNRTGSRRPVALVLIAPAVSTADLDILRPHARVLFIPSDAAASGEDIRLRLHELMPLTLPSPLAERMRTVAALRQDLTDSSEPLLDKLIGAARGGVSEVESAFVDQLKRILAGTASTPES